MKFVFLAAAILVCSVSVQVAEELDLEERPEGAVGPIPGADFDRGFECEDGMEALRFVEGLLGKYREGADTLVSGGKALEEVEAIGFPDWESRVIGAANAGKTLAGTLLRQEYLLRRAELEILRLRNAGPEEIAVAEEDQAKAADAVRRFWDGYSLVD